MGIHNKYYLIVLLPGTDKIGIIYTAKYKNQSYIML